MFISEIVDLSAAIKMPFFGYCSLNNRLSSGLNRGTILAADVSSILKVCLKAERNLWHLMTCVVFAASFYQILLIPNVTDVGERLDIGRLPVSATFNLFFTVPYICCDGTRFIRFVNFLSVTL